MKVYKFKDTAEGNYAFVFAQNEKAASEKLSQETALKFELVSCKDAADFNTPIILINRILPF